MRIIADISCTQDPTSAERGIPTYAREHAKAIERVRPGLVEQWTLLPDGPVPKSLDFLLSTGRLAKLAGDTTDGADLVHVMSPFYEKQDAWGFLRGSRANLAVTLYDLIPLVYPDTYLRTIGQRSRYHAQLQLVRSADRVLCISKATADDALRLLDLDPRRVEVIGTGVESQFHRPVDPEEAAEAVAEHVLGLRPGFLMCTSGIEFRKNIDRLIVAYSLLPAELRHEHQLVIVCRIEESTRNHLMVEAAKLGIDERDILFTGLVSSEALIAMYQTAHLFVFPSFYEGFGLPVAEAMASGAPCVVASNSSLIDLQPIAEARFDAFDPADMASVIARGLRDHEFRKELLAVSQASSHTWDAVAERTIAAYEDLGPVARRAVTSTRARKRIALVTPMPPARSGVADYSARLLPELLEYVDVDVFTQASAVRTEAPGLRWFNSRSVDIAETVYGAYDDRIFCMGNSPFHHDVHRILQRARRGTVMSHDVNLQDMYSEAVRHSPNMVSRHAKDIIWRRSGTLLPETMEEYSAHREPSYYHYNNPLSVDVLEMADRLLVHSRTAATLAKLEAPASLHSKVDVVSFGYRPVVTVSREQRDAVISMGIVATPKQSFKVIDAFISIASRHPGVVFAAVGHLAIDLRGEREIRGRISELGLTDRVILTGHVGSAEYDEWLGRGLLAVQLRDLSKGESSAAIADCFSYGVPVLASDVGSARELPREAVDLVRREITVEELGEVISGMLQDPRRLASMSEASIDYARNHQFELSATDVLSRMGLIGAPGAPSASS